MFGHVAFRVTRDQSAESTRAARCVVGEEEDCGATSGEMTDEASVVDWMTRHTADTGHTRFTRVFIDYATVERRGPIAVPGISS
ncbi:DUF7848 domain-containing protein [Streptomyces sp. NPDC001130]